VADDATLTCARAASDLATKLKLFASERKARRGSANLWEVIMGSSRLRF